MLQREILKTESFSAWFGACFHILKASMDLLLSKKVKFTQHKLFTQPYFLPKHIHFCLGLKYFEYFNSNYARFCHYLLLIICCNYLYTVFKLVNNKH